MERRMAQIEESVARYLEQLDTADRQEPSEALTTKANRLKEKIETLKQQMRGLERLKVEMLRSRWASAIRARPACVLGPVDLPSWKRQRALPGSALTWQQPPARVLAPQRRRLLRRFGDGWLETSLMSRFYQ
jgi:hypothetical protein